MRATLGQLGLWGIEGDWSATAPWFSWDPSYDCCSIFLPSVRAIRGVGEGAWSMEGGGGVVEVSVVRCHATGLSGRQSAAMLNAGTRYDSHHMVLYMCTLGSCAVMTGILWRKEKWSGIRTFLGVRQHLWGFFQNEFSPVKMIYFSNTFYLTIRTEQALSVYFCVLTWFMSPSLQLN